VISFWEGAGGWELAGENESGEKRMRRWGLVEDSK
jgi:hypothetical protein